MNREALVQRNIRLAASRHRPTLKQRLRDSGLRLLAKAPVLQSDQPRQRLLVIRPDHLGDVLLTTPALKLLKRRRPNLELHVLCGPWSASLLAAYPEIDQVITLPFPGFNRVSEPTNPNGWLGLLKSARMLRRIGYGGAIIMRPDHWWGALLAYAAGIPQRIGYELSGVAPLLTRAIQYQRQHAVTQSLRLAQAWLEADDEDETVELGYPIAAADDAWIASYLAERNLGSSSPTICIHPGSGADSKLWQNDKWAAVADALDNEFRAAIIFTGTSAEERLSDTIIAQMRAQAMNLAGMTSIGQSAALFRRSLLVLGTDNGAMHLAAAVGTPTVTLFGPADPMEFAPWGPPRRHAIVTSAIDCRPCRILDWRNDSPDYHPCVREISVDEVLAAARRLLHDQCASP